MNTETLTNLLVVLAGIPALGAVLTYGIGSPWWRSWLGRVTFGLLLGIALLVGLALARRLFGAYPGHELVALIDYALVTLSLWGIWVVILVERRSPHDPERKAPR